MNASIHDLNPTQISVGYEQVEEKMFKLINLKKNLDKYLKERVVPVIAGPNNKLYIVDHHHLCHALLKLQLDKVFIKVIKDWSEYTESDFWNKMKEKEKIWQYDETGKYLELPEFIEKLPKHIIDLKNDPYRSLAGLVRKHKGYNKVWVPFSEFRWANYFRENDIKLKPNTKIITIEELHKGLKLAKICRASYLPGYINK
jgi:hypothetical protein